MEVMESNKDINPFCLSKCMSHPRFTERRKSSGIIWGQILVAVLRTISSTCAEKLIIDDKCCALVSTLSISVTNG